MAPCFLRFLVKIELASVSMFGGRRLPKRLLKIGIRRPLPNSRVAPGLHIEILESRLHLSVTPFAKQVLSQSFQNIRTAIPALVELASPAGSSAPPGSALTPA